MHEARREAERIIADAQQRAAEIRPPEPEVARVQTEGDPTDIASAVQTLNAAAIELLAAIEEFREEALSEVIELSMAIAERVTKRAGLIDPAVLAENLREAMKLVVRTTGLRIAVHPQQVELLKEAISQQKAESPALATAEIVADETVTPGGCRIATAHGRIDADLQTQLDRLAERLIPGRV